MLELCVSGWTFDLRTNRVRGIAIRNTTDMLWSDYIIESSSSGYTIERDAQLVVVGIPMLLEDTTRSGHHDQSSRNENVKSFASTSSRVFIRKDCSQDAKSRVLTEGVVRNLSAPIYCGDLDTTTLRDLIDSDGKLIPKDPIMGC
ncbi:hypothetical protein Tco_0609591 [Tanacetum coccineum]